MARASTGSKILNSILRFVNFKSYLEKILDSGKINERNGKEPSRYLLLGLDLEKKQINGRTVFIIKSKKEKSKTNILFFHGGAYINNFSIIHWLLLRQIVKATKCTVIAPDYPLAPKNTYKDSFKMVIPIYEDLLAKVGGENIILMGDSSGGGFALALAEKMQEEHREKANQIILLSPWLDITLKNKEILKVDPKDPVLGIDSLKRAGKLYAGASDCNNYLLSPINGEIQGLGKISIFIGTNDILEPDARKFNKIAKEKGVEINYYESKDMIHTWMFFYLKESKETIKEIVNLIKSN